MPLFDGSSSKSFSSNRRRRGGFDIFNYHMLDLMMKYARFTSETGICSLNS